jgi:hypothetical protein
MVRLPRLLHPPRRKAKAASSNSNTTANNRNLVNGKMMIARALLSFLTLAGVEAATRIAVLEFGAGGSVHQSTSKNVDTTVAGVASFWGALHGDRRKLQHSGMPLVPDLFKKSDSGVVIGLSGSGVDLDLMPYVSSLVSEQRENVIGHLEVEGEQLNPLLSKVEGWETIDILSAADYAQAQGEKAGLSGFKVTVDTVAAKGVDKQMKAVLSNLKSMADESGRTIVVHLVVEEEASTARPRRQSRRLQEDNQNQNANGNDQYSGYYGYGYYDQNNNWVSTYKSMFQIQYFNVVLWTSIGLVIVLFFTISLMMNMPLEPDTLLFGESARVASD